MSEEPEESMFEKIVRGTFMFIGGLILAAFLVFGVCTLVVMG